MFPLPFRDRGEAGRLLAEELASRKLPPNTIVLALPRGGVPIGLTVAKALHAPLDVVVVRKLGVPWQPELAMGAIAGRSGRVLDERMIGELRISQEEVDAVISRERMEAERREKLYRGGRPAPDLRGRTVVLVDDGLATGSTMVVAARYVRSLKPGRLIIAVPIASAQASQRVRMEADSCVCLATPEHFVAVGEWYSDFRQVGDCEVQHLLEQASRRLELPEERELELRG